MPFGTRASNDGCPPRDGETQPFPDGPSEGPFDAYALNRMGGYRSVVRRKA